MSKYDEYLKCKCCQDILLSEYGQVIKNIIDDDETYITESMKIDLFLYLARHDGISDMMQYWDDFFDHPKGKDLSEKTYLLKGRIIDNSIYNKKLGRVSSLTGFMRSLKTALSKITVPISDFDDEAFTEIFFIEPEDISNTSSQLFIDYANDTGILNFKIQEHPMWTFEGLDDEDVYKGIKKIKDLPCILGLPGPFRTSSDYNKIPRITFSFFVPKYIIVRKPTSFDAGYMPVWCGGGKAKAHKECQSDYTEFLFEEYIHEPVLYKNITSQLIKI
jgi:hypothetical protein